jgi:glycosidase
LPWWHGAAIYQIYPRSFADSNGDGIGDLAGITARLDHVARLGADAIWISPFFTSPMRDFGYDVADYCDVDPVFGTLADFDALVARAHDLGLKVTIDQVYAHTSDQHPWFVASRQSRDNPYADWYVWEDPKPDGSPRRTGNRCSAARRGAGTRGAASTTCTISWPNSRRSMPTTRRCSRRSLMSCASGSIAGSTASASTRSIS